VGQQHLYSQVDSVQELQQKDRSLLETMDSWKKKLQERTNELEALQQRLKEEDNHITQMTAPKEEIVVKDIQDVLASDDAGSLTLEAQQMLRSATQISAIANEVQGKHGSQLKHQLEQVWKLRGEVAAKEQQLTQFRAEVERILERTEQERAEAQWMQENSSKNVHTILDKYGLQSVDDTACLLGQISKIPFQVNKVNLHLGGFIHSLSKALPLLDQALESLHNALVPRSYDQLGLSERQQGWLVEAGVTLQDFYSFENLSPEQFKSTFLSRKEPLSPIQIQVLMNKRTKEIDFWHSQQVLTQVPTLGVLCHTEFFTKANLAIIRAEKETKINIPLLK